MKRLYVSGVVCLMLAGATAALAQNTNPPVLNSLASPDYDGQFTLSWTPVPGATSYEFFEFTNNPPTWISGSWTQFQVWGGATASRTVTKYKDGTWYYYVRTWTTNAQGQPIWGNLGSQMVTQQVILDANQAKPPAAMDNPVANPSTDGGYWVTWQPLAGATSYELFEFTNNPPTWAPGTWTQIQTWGASSAKRFFYKQQSGTWYYQMRTWSTNLQGQYLYSTLGQQVITQRVVVSADSPKPPPPMDEAVNPDDDGQYALTWTPIPGATSYEIFEFNTWPPPWTPGSWTQYQVWGGSSSAKIFTKTNSGTWYYEMRTWSQNSQGQWIYGQLGSQTIAQQVTIGPNSLKPPPILNDPVNPSMGGTFTLTWTPVPGAVSYEFFEFTNNPPTWIPGSWTQFQTWSGSQGSVTLVKTNSGSWYYSIRSIAQDTQGWPVYGHLGVQIVTQQVLVGADIPKPPPVLNNPVNPDRDGNYKVSWSTVPGAASYEIFEFTNYPPSWNPGSWTQLQVWSGTASNVCVSKTSSGAWYYSARTWSVNSQGQWICGGLGTQVVTQQVALSFTAAQVSNLNRYASGSVRYFTSSQANNKLGGFAHTQFGTGKGRTGSTEFNMSRETASHVNINEVTLRFLSLAAASKMNWLTYLPDSSRYADSWGQIKTGLQTLRNMQTSGDITKFRYGNFHRTYWTTWGGVNDYQQTELRWDQQDKQSSDDQGLPCMNLLMLEGLANSACTNDADRVAITNYCNQIRNTLNLRRFVVNGKIVHEFSNNVANTSLYWDRSGAEGVPIISAMLLTTNQPLSRSEFTNIAPSIQNRTVNWQYLPINGSTIGVTQATYHAAMFIHGLRSLHGLPVTTDEAAGARFYDQSLFPVFSAHMNFASYYNYSALGSQPMTQTLAGYPLFQGSDGKQIQYPGNHDNVHMVPGQTSGISAMARMTAPHAWFVALSRPYKLASSQIQTLFQWMSAYEGQFFHAGSDVNNELGWEAVIPWNPGDISYSWVDTTGRRNYADYGRPYEGLNAAYTVLHIFDALNPDKPLAAYNVEKTRCAAIAAYFDSGTPLPANLFP